MLNFMDTCDFNCAYPFGSLDVSLRVYVMLGVVAVNIRRCSRGLCVCIYIHEIQHPPFPQECN